MRHAAGARLLVVPALLALGARPDRLLHVGGGGPAHGDRGLQRRRRPGQRRPGADGRRPRRLGELHRARRDKAKVTLAFDNGVRIPADVQRGHRPHHHPRRPVRRAHRAQERDRRRRRRPRRSWPTARVIHKTSVVPDVEQFIQAGSDVFGAVSTTELEQIIEAGGQGFTGQEASLKAFLTDLTAVTNGYAQHTDDITQAVNGLNSLTLDAGARRAAPARPRSTTWPRPSRSWPRTPSQFETLLQSLDNLSTQGRSILETYYPQIVDPAADAAGGEQPAGAAPGRPGRPPLRDPGRRQRAAPGRAQRLRAALREHHRLRHPRPGRGRQPAGLHLRAAQRSGERRRDHPPPHRQPDRLLRRSASRSSATASSTCWATRCRARRRSRPSSPTRRASTRASRSSSTACPSAR